ncbi:MAG: hypothetical protein JOZ69_14405 [Myxococcales bacterium]|nr:hypothetical protein [Myxococcales bacterium]
MKTPVDARLRLEAARFGFRFACDDCAHRAGEGDTLGCSLGYPAEPRPGDLARSQIVLCKSFELC